MITEEQCQPSEFPSSSLQWLPSSELLKAISMNRVFTFTESMTMPGNAVDTEYQKSPSQFIESELITIGPTLLRILTCVVGRPCLDFII